MISIPILHIADATADALLEAGLAMPPCAELAERLRGAGFDIPADAYRPEELKRAILENLGRGGKNA